MHTVVQTTLMLCAPSVTMRRIYPLHAGDARLKVNICSAVNPGERLC